MQFQSFIAYVNVSYNIGFRILTSNSFLLGVLLLITSVCYQSYEVDRTRRSRSTTKPRIAMQILGRRPGLSINNIMHQASNPAAIAQTPVPGRCRFSSEMRIRFHSTFAVRSR